MNALALRYDYDKSLPGGKASEAAALTRDIKSLTASTKEGILALGEKFLRMKSLLPHGQFGPWLKLELESDGYSLMTAQRYMRLASLQKTTTLLFLPIDLSALHLLAAAPEEVRDEFIAKAEAGEPVTHKEVKAAVTKVTPPPRKEIPRSELVMSPLAKEAEASCALDGDTQSTGSPFPFQTSCEVAVPSWAYGKGHMPDEDDTPDDIFEDTPPDKPASADPGLKKLEGTKDARRVPKVRPIDRNIERAIGVLKRAIDDRFLREDGTKGRGREWHTDCHYILNRLGERHDRWVEETA